MSPPEAQHGLLCAKGQCAGRRRPAASIWPAKAKSAVDPAAKAIFAPACMHYIMASRCAAFRSQPQGNREMPQAMAQRTPSAPNDRQRLLEIVKQKSLLRGNFKLVSGAISDYYLDMKPTTFDPEGASLIAGIICRMLEDDPRVDAIGGLELG